MRTLYLDCFSGVAGDMLLGALLDVGADEAFVREQLGHLDLSGWTLDVEDVTRSGVRATQARVQVQSEQRERDAVAVRGLLAAAELDARVKRVAQRVFDRLLDAEARVHGVDVEQVHLHEVGAVDAFIDIVGASAALVSLAAGRIVCSPLPLGGGRTHGSHGPLPIPPPAVAELVAGVPVRGGGERELVTPTGAALVTSIADAFGDLPPMKLERTGYGAGSTDSELPNVVRVFIGEAVEARDRPALLIEANVDDMSPELIPHAIERLMTAGAHDAWVTPIVMKKGRPAFTLSALVPTSERERVIEVFYAETTTFGVRIAPVTKDELGRSWIEVDVGGHPIRVKCARRGGSIITQSPEYADALKAANATGIPLKDVFRMAAAEAGEKVRTL